MKVVLGNPTSLCRVQADVCWLIARAGPDLAGYERHRELAPDRNLFQIYLLRRRGRDPAQWWPEYEQRFNLLLERPAALAALEEVRALTVAGKIVALACWCKDGMHCHRRLVGEALRARGVATREV